MGTENRVFVQLDATAYDSDSASYNSAEADLGPYVNSGKRQIQAVWAPAVTGADTDETYNCKLQESASTVDSDFSDISGAAFTQVTSESTKAFQTLLFNTMKRYVRSVVTIAGTSATIQNWVGLLVEPRFDT